MKQGENVGCMFDLYLARESEKTRRREAVTAEPSSVLREPPAKSGPQEQRPRDPLLGQSRKASYKKKGQAEWERQPRCWCIAGRRAQTFQGLGELWAWGELSWGPGEGSVCPGTQDQPLPISCFVFPALWFPNLFGLKFVSNFFFPHVIET